jgi:hypothetical protein
MNGGKLGTMPRRCRECREWIRLVVESATLIAVIVYTVINGKLFHELKRENLRQAQQFLVAQRPYITIGRADATLMEWQMSQIEKGGVVKIYFQNTGNMAATNFHVWAWLSFGLGKVKLPFEPTEIGHPVHNWPLPDFNSKKAVESPVTTKIGARSNWIDYAYSRSVLTQRDIDNITNDSGLVEIYGFYEYGDGLGDYWCEPIRATYTSGRGVWVLAGFSMSDDPFSRSLCKGHNHQHQ